VGDDHRQEHALAHALQSGDEDAGARQQVEVDALPRLRVEGGEEWLPRVPLAEVVDEGVPVWDRDRGARRGWGAGGDDQVVGGAAVFRCQRPAGRQAERSLKACHALPATGNVAGAGANGQRHDGSPRAVGVAEHLLQAGTGRASGSEGACYVVGCQHGASLVGCQLARLGCQLRPVEEVAGEPLPVGDAGTHAANGPDRQPWQGRVCHLPGGPGEGAADERAAVEGCGVADAEHRGGDGAGEGERSGGPVGEWFTPRHIGEEVLGVDPSAPRGRSTNGQEIPPVACENAPQPLDVT
jgi:hypothetical protein